MAMVDGLKHRGSDFIEICSVILELEARDVFVFAKPGMASKTEMLPHLMVEVQSIWDSHNLDVLKGCFGISHSRSFTDLALLLISAFLMNRCGFDSMIDFTRPPFTRDCPMQDPACLRRPDL